MSSRNHITGFISSSSLEKKDDTIDGTSSDYLFASFDFSSVLYASRVDVYIEVEKYENGEWVHYSNFNRSTVYASENTSPQSNEITEYNDLDYGPYNYMVVRGTGDELNPPDEEGNRRVKGIDYDIYGYSEDPAPEVYCDINAEWLPWQKREYINIRAFKEEGGEENYLTGGFFPHLNSGADTQTDTIVFDDWREFMTNEVEENVTVNFYITGEKDAIALVPEGMYDLQTQYSYYYDKITISLSIFEEKSISFLVEDISTSIDSPEDVWNMKYGIRRDFELSSNIDMNNFSASHLPSSLDDYLSNYTPTDFQGTINGKNNTINNLGEPLLGNCNFLESGNIYRIKDLNIVANDMNVPDGYGGLCANIGDNYEIDNCSIAGNIIAEANSAVAGLVFFVFSGAKVINSYADVDIMGSNDITAGLCAYWQSDYNLENLYHKGKIENGGETSGLVYQSSGEIINCYHEGDVTGSGPTAGLLLYATENINDCYVTGNIKSDNAPAGGLIYQTDSNVIVSNSYVVGNIEALNAVAGGFIYSDRNNSEFESCYVEGDVTADSPVGGFSYEINGTIKNSYFEGNVESLSAPACGFVYLSDCNIEKSYVGVNSQVKTSGAPVSGFVYTSSEIIKNCYSRAGINNEFSDDNAGFIYSGNCNLENCYFAGVAVGTTKFSGFAPTTSTDLTLINCYYELLDSMLGVSNSLGYGVSLIQMKPYFDMGNKPEESLKYWKRYEKSEGEVLDDWQNETWYEQYDKVKDGENYYECEDAHLSLINGVYYLWDFDNVWGIKTEINDGYPNLQETGYDFDYIEMPDSLLEINSEFNFARILQSFLASFEAVTEYNVFSSSNIFFDISAQTQIDADFIKNYYVEVISEIETNYIVGDISGQYPIVRTDFSYRTDDTLTMSGTLLSPGPYEDELWERKITGFIQYASGSLDFREYSINETTKTTLPNFTQTTYTADVEQDIAVSDTEIFISEMPAEFEITAEDNYKYLLISDGDKEERIGYANTEERVEGGETLYVISQIDRGILGSTARAFLAVDTTVAKTTLAGSFSWEDDMYPAAKKTDYRYRAGIEISTQLQDGTPATFRYFGGIRNSGIDESGPFENMARDELFVDARDLETNEELLDRVKLKFKEMEIEEWNLEEFKKWTWEEFSDFELDDNNYNTITDGEAIKIADGITEYDEQDLILNYTREEIDNIIKNELDVTTADDIDGWDLDVSKLIARLITMEPEGVYDDWNETEIKDLLKTILTDEFSYSDFESSFPFEKWETTMKARLEITINNNASIEVEYNQYGPYNYLVDFQLGDIIVVEYPDVFRAMIRIIGVKEEHTPEGTKYTLTLGKEFKTLIDNIKNDINNVGKRL